ncbi:SURF1 family protein [Asticcacaulis solisilvae]|uniref:SURF1 family protein n=1 Tax=Asticcacaulis solisilvae TaxID=1217274 RepID=UPI003FD7EE6B
MRRIIVGTVVVVCVAVLISLGLWQVQRLAWKTDLIARVNARVNAPAVAAPPATAVVSVKEDEYRHVAVRGRFLNAAEAQVYTVSDYGGGYWVMTPLKRDDGTIVFINRGFVPIDKQDPKTRAAGDTDAEVTVTGLLRIPETRGWLFSQANDPASDRWYRRDIAAIAVARHLGPVASYFIDADATPNPGGWPKGGLTVIHFPNSHLMYAITWFSMALGLAGVTIWLTWFRKPSAD